jgi:hypothetical protein
MSSPGQGQPCPCGSGRRFAECCGPSAQAPAGATVRESALGKLLNFAFQPAFDSDHSIAEGLFWGNLIRGGATPELRWLLDSEEATIKYNSWFLFDWEVDNSGTVADLFLRDEEVSAAERQFIRRMAAAHLRLYEVEAVERGLGVHLLDVWTGHRLFVIERAATAQMVTWDLLGARVAPDGLGGQVFEGGLYLYPADVKESVVRHFRKLHRQHHRKFPFDDLEAFFHKHGAAFNHLWLNLVAFPDPPQLLTTEGDPLVFCRSVFETDDPDTVLAGLSTRAEIRRRPDGHLSWRETADDGDRELGSWSVQGDRVVLESTSQERAARGRAWLEALFGDQVRYRATSLETLEQTMNELRSRRPGPSPSTTHDVPAESADAVRALFDRHYRSWIDRPLPALGNRTPRAAAAARLWRPKVMDLIKQLENGAERASNTSRPAYDVGWLWRELGLARPGPNRG